MKSYILTLTLIIFMSLGYSGCSSSDGDSSSPASSSSNPTGITTGITGSVTDMNGIALQNVTVYAQSLTTTTDENGLFTLSTSATKDISLTAQLSNYARNTKLVTVEEGSLSTQVIKLAQVDTIESFDSSTGATVKAKGASVTLPDAYTLDDGTPYSGKVTVKATYNRVTTVNGSEAYPGEFMGETTSGDTQILQSYGFIDVTIESEKGENLQLGASATATLTYPIDPTISDRPDTIPLWYFDTQKGIWVEDGLATFDASTNTYVGDVTHFSTWNLDAAFVGSSLKGCIEDANGVRIQQSDLYLSAPGWDKGIHNHTFNNDSKGEFELINAPSNIELILIAKVGNLASQEKKVTLLPGEAKVMSDCLKIDQNSSNLFGTITVRVVDGNFNPIKNQYVNILDKNSSNSLSYSASDSNGNITLSYARSGVTNIKITSSYKYVNFEKTFTLDPNDKTTDLGDFVLATTTFKGCVTLEDGSSTSDKNITTLADGKTLVDDGTIIHNDGNTSFGTDKRDVAIDTPYNVNSYSPTQFDANRGLFTLVVAKDNTNHDVYAHTYQLNTTTKDSDYGKITINTKGYTLTGKLSFLANQVNVTKTATDECIELHKIQTLSKSATASLSTSNTDVHVEVTFVQNSSSWGEIIAGENSTSKSASFKLNNNGVYIIKQVTNDYNLNVTFEGTMSLVLDGTTHTITLPNSATTGVTGQPSEWWTGFRVEVYDGTVTVKEINKAW